MYFRARSIPTDPATSFQTTVRTAFINAVSRWESLLTDVERDAWAVYAQNTLLTDTLGDPLEVSGFNMFVRVNVPNIQAGLPIIVDAPIVFNLGESGIVSFTANATLNQFSVSFDNSREWANADDGALLLYFSRPQNATINFFKGPFRFAAAILGDAITPPTSPAVVAAPFAIAVDQRIWMQCRSLTPDGRLTSATVIGPVVAA